MNVHNRDGKESMNHTRIVTREEEAKIVTLLRSPKHCKVRSYYADIADLVVVLADTGMRLGEALSLLNTDIDLTSNIILIRVTKGNHRRVPMTKRVAAILKRRQEINPQKPFNINEYQISRAWYWVKEQIGLKDDKYFVLHTLRKTCVYRLINAGVELEIVQDWLGYRTIQPRRLAPLPLLKLVQAAELLDKWCSNNPSE